MAIATQTLNTALLILAAFTIALPAVLLAIKSIRGSKQIKEESWNPNKPPTQPNSIRFRYGNDAEEWAREYWAEHYRLKTKPNQPPPPTQSSKPKLDNRYGINSAEFARKLREAGSQLNTVDDIKKILRDSESSCPEQSHCNNHSSSDHSSSSYSDCSSSSCSSGD